MRTLLILLLALTLITAACSDDAEPRTSSVATTAPSATPPPAIGTSLPPGSPAASATPPAHPPTPSPAATAPPHTVHLFNVTAGIQTTVFESRDETPVSLAFDGDQVLIDLLPAGSGGQVIRSRRALDGAEISRAPLDQIAPCIQDGPDARVALRLYRDLTCGPISPDRRWMTYQVAAGEVAVPSGLTVRTWDQWIIDLATDERRLLQSGLRNCGGCDGRFGPAWSASGRYLYFSELLAGGRIFLSDLQARTTRLLHEGSTEITARPDWSPAADLLVYPDEAATVTILEDLSTGARTPLTVLPWPARFDTTGAYLYSPAWPDARAALPTTTVYHLPSRAITLLPGQPSQGNLWQDEQPVSGAGGTFIAALFNADGCAGAAVYRGDARLACIPGGEAARPAPTANLVAVARLTTPPTPGRTGTYEVVLIDMLTGRLRSLISDLSSPAPPRLVWNDTGAHLLVQSPAVLPGP